MNDRVACYLEEKANGNQNGSSEGTVELTGGKGKNIPGRGRDILPFDSREMCQRELVETVLLQFLQENG